MPDLPSPSSAQRLNVYQQPWTAFTDALNSVDPAFERFSLAYRDLGWTYRRNLNRHPARQVDRKDLSVKGQPWFCLGVEVMGHWYRVNLSSETLFEFMAVATWHTSFGQILVR